MSNGVLERRAKQTEKWMLVFICFLMIPVSWADAGMGGVGWMLLALVISND